MLLNYTTKVPAYRTADEVHRLLVSAGASSITTTYDTDRRPRAVRFQVDTPLGHRVFVLPVNVEKVRAVLVRQKVEQRYRAPEHAERVAWRILKDWLEAQLAILQSEMVTFDQVMLPYMEGDDTGRTLYDLYLDQSQKALEAAK